MQRSLLFILLILTSYSAGAKQLAPHEMIQQVANTTFKQLKQDKQQIEKEPAHIKQILIKELMPHVDHQLAAKILLDKTPGTDEQKLAFYRAFEQYPIATYATIFAKYVDQQLEVEPTTDFAGQKVVTVKARLTQDGRPNIPIEFKLRTHPQSNDWQLFDMVVEGVSLLFSKKAELKAIFRQDNGIETATRLLAEKAQSSDK